jgi:hypothetical protein
VQAAIQWQKISAGDWAAYAADISDRDDSHGPPALRMLASADRSSGPMIIPRKMTAQYSLLPGSDLWRASHSPGQANRLSSPCQARIPSEPRKECR